MNKGEIILRRKDKSYTASFGIVKAAFPDIEKKLSTLHPIEQKYYQSLKFNRRKANYLLGRLAARQALSVWVEEQQMASFFIDYGVSLFPVLKGVSNQNLQLSISHCDTISIALVYPEEHPLGIDLELINAAKVEVMKSVINPSELKLISKAGLPTAVNCTIIWTVKEGLSKILRTGLSMDLTVFEINEFKKQQSVYISTFKNLGLYKAISFYASKYICTIVLPKNTNPDLSYFEHILKPILEKSSVS